MRTSQTGRRGRRQTRQACGRQVWFSVQEDSQRAGGGWPVPIEQISNVLSVGHEFHRSKHWSLWNTAAHSMTIRLTVANRERLPAIGQVRVKPLQRHAIDRETTMTDGQHDGQPCRRLSWGQETSLPSPDLCRLFSMMSLSEQRFRSSGADGKPIVEPEVGCSDRSARRI